MPQRTDIEWTDYSSNPLKLRLRVSGAMVNACVKCSPGCAECYAKAITERFWPKAEGAFPGYSVALLKRGEVVLNDNEVRNLLTFRPRPPFRHGDRPLVFIGDMTDVFGEWVPDELLDRLFAVFALRPDVTFQVLTKRPERMAAYLYDTGIDGRRRAVVKQMHELNAPPAPQAWRDASAEVHYGRSWPLPNVWLGTSVEDQQRAEERIPHLLKCPAAVRFLSVEPLLGPVHFGRVKAWDPFEMYLTDIHWVIVGGESGSKARPCDSSWLRSVVRQCRNADVPCFVKQWGAKPVATLGGQHTATGTKTFPVMLKSPKGSDMAEWPEDLRVRQFPEVAEVARGH